MRLRGVCDVIRNLLDCVHVASLQNERHGMCRVTWSAGNLLREREKGRRECTQLEACD